MKRNWYAAAILLLLILALFGCNEYVKMSAQAMRQDVQTAYAYAQASDFERARDAYSKAADNAKTRCRRLELLIRRSLLDKVTETMSVLYFYAQPDNLSDLAVETARVCALIDQMENSFVGCL